MTHSKFYLGMIRAYLIVIEHRLMFRSPAETLRCPRSCQPRWFVGRGRPPLLANHWVTRQSLLLVLLEPLDKLLRHHARIIHSRDFVLTAKFPTRLHPFAKATRWYDLDFR